MNVLSLFSGIGAYEQALKNIGIEINIKAFCEIDNFAIKSYCALHAVPPTLNLGNIRSIDIDKLSNLSNTIDIITTSPPCTNISKMGDNAGAKLGSNTSSSLIWNNIDIINIIRPKLIILENVATLCSVKHLPIFNQYLEVLNNLGYTNSYQILNSSDFGVPQDRKRVYLVSIYNSQHSFTFPTPTKCTTTIEDFLNLSQNTSEYKNYKTTYSITENRIDEGLRKYTHTYCPTLRTSSRCGDKIVRKESIQIRNISPRECWQLMGFSNHNFDTVKKLGHSTTQLYRQAGNSVSVNVLEAIFKKLLMIIK